MTRSASSDSARLGEAAQVAEQHGGLEPVAGQAVVLAGALDHVVDDLRRHEAGERRAHALARAATGGQVDGERGERADHQAASGAATGTITPARNAR